MSVVLSNEVPDFGVHFNHKHISDDDDDDDDDDSEQNELKKNVEADLLAVMADTDLAGAFDDENDEENEMVHHDPVQQVPQTRGNEEWISEFSSPEAKIPGVSQKSSLPQSSWSPAKRHSPNYNRTNYAEHLNGKLKEIPTSSKAAEEPLVDYKVSYQRQGMLTEKCMGFVASTNLEKVHRQQLSYDHSNHVNAGQDSLQQQQFLLARGDSEEQLKLLLENRGRQIDDLKLLHGKFKEESAREIQLLHHKLSMAVNEQEDMAVSKQHLQDQLQEEKNNAIELHGKISALEEHRLALTDAKQEFADRLRGAESSLATMREKIREHESNDNIHRTQYQHQQIVAQLTQKYQLEILNLQQKLNEIIHENEEKSEDLNATKKQLSESIKSGELLRIERAESINRLTQSLEDSQKKCEQLLNEHRGEELSKLKASLQDALAARSITEDVNRSLQDTVNEQNEHISILEALAKVSGPSIDEAANDTYEGLGIKTKSRSEMLLPEETINTLRTELNRLLILLSTKRTQLAHSQQEYEKVKLEVGGNKLLYEKTKLELEAMQIQFDKSNKRCSEFENSSGSYAEVKLNKEIVRLNNDKKVLMEEVEELTSRVDEANEKEAKLKEQKRKLEMKMSAGMEEKDQDNLEAMERYKNECLKLCDESKMMFKKESEKEMQQIRNELRCEQEKLCEVQNLYVRNCDEKEKLENLIQQLQEDNAKLIELKEEAVAAALKNAHEAIDKSGTIKLEKIKADTIDAEAKKWKATKKSLEDELVEKFTTQLNALKMQHLQTEQSLKTECEMAERKLEDLKQFSEKEKNFLKEQIESNQLKSSDTADLRKKLKDEYEDDLLKVRATCRKEVQESLESEYRERLEREKSTWNAKMQEMLRDATQLKTKMQEMGMELQQKSESSNSTRVQNVLKKLVQVSWQDSFQIDPDREQIYILSQEEVTRLRDEHAVKTLQIRKTYEEKIAKIKADHERKSESESLGGKVSRQQNAELTAKVNSLIEEASRNQQQSEILKEQKAADETRVSELSSQVALLQSCLESTESSDQLRRAESRAKSAERMAEHRIRAFQESLAVEQARMMQKLEQEMMEQQKCFEAEKEQLLSAIKKLKQKLSSKSRENVAQSESELRVKENYLGAIRKIKADVMKLLGAEVHISAEAQKEREKQKISDEWNRRYRAGLSKLIDQNHSELTHNEAEQLLDTALIYCDVTKNSSPTNISASQNESPSLQNSSSGVSTMRSDPSMLHNGVSTMHNGRVQSLLNVSLVNSSVPSSSENTSSRSAARNDKRTNDEPARRRNKVSQKIQQLASSYDATMLGNELRLARLSPESETPHGIPHSLSHHGTFDDLGYDGSSNGQHLRQTVRQVKRNNVRMMRQRDGFIDTGDEAYDSCQSRPQSCSSVRSASCTRNSAHRVASASDRLDIEFQDIDFSGWNSPQRPKSPSTSSHLASLSSRSMQNLSSGRRTPELSSQMYSPAGGYESSMLRDDMSQSMSNLSGCVSGSDGEAVMPRRPVNKSKLRGHMARTQVLLKQMSELSDPVHPRINSQSSNYLSLPIDSSQESLQSNSHHSTFKF